VGTCLTQLTSSFADLGYRKTFAKLPFNFSLPVIIAWIGSSFPYMILRQVLKAAVSVNCASRALSLSIMAVSDDLP
jgi:hypothetical protein